jgi:glucosylceramidase
MSHPILVLMFLICVSLGSFAQSVSVFQTTHNLGQKLQSQPSLGFGDRGANSLSIAVDPARRYQQVDGFGASITDSSAWLLYTKLNETQRTNAMQLLFSRSNGIALSFLRQPMGASDLSLNFYTYDDVAISQGDPTLSSFSIEHDTAYILPVLREALALNPNIKIMATPWSPPAWMKTNHSLLGVNGWAKARLRQEAYASLATYFVKFVEAYRSEGVNVDYVSMQNEPLFVPGGYTGMLMSPGEQLDLLNNHLAPAFRGAGITSKILIFDHNWDGISYPRAILADPAGRANAAGVAWHHYHGSPEAMTTLHNQYPTLDSWVTESSGGDWQRSNVLLEEGRELVNSMRNWARSYVLWNMALDQDRGPVAKTPSGAHGCGNCRGVVKVVWDKRKTGGASAVVPEADYYVLGHASKFVEPGAVRIYSDQITRSGLYDVAFQNPDGSIVLYVVNSTMGQLSFDVRYRGRFLSATVAQGSIATFVWQN